LVVVQKVEVIMEVNSARVRNRDKIIIMHTIKLIQIDKITIGHR